MSFNDFLIFSYMYIFQSLNTWLHLYYEAGSIINTRDGSSGVLEPHCVYPCNSGPAPINMLAKLRALEEGSTVRFSNV